MIKFWYSGEKTNSYRPTPWHWSVEPFPAFRGWGARYTAFQAVSQNFIAPPDAGKSDDGFSCPLETVDERPSKIIKTAKKGTLLLVPCPSEEDERIALITLRGGFRGSYSRIGIVEGEILSQRGGNVHCCPTEHLVVRFPASDSYLFAETGRRCGTGLVEIFSWRDGYFSLPTEEFEVWVDIGDL